MSTEDARWKIEMQERTGREMSNAILKRLNKDSGKRLKQIRKMKGRVRKKAAAERQLEASLLQAERLQKWRVDEAEVVVCCHGNIRKRGR